MLEHRTEVPLLIAFADRPRFFAQSQRVSDLDLADTLDAFYECVAVPIEKAGGRVVKFRGDAALIVFPEDAVDRGVQALLQTKDAVDELMVIGKAVNTAATLDGSEVTLSVAAFRKVEPELRRRFRKHTPPVSYIRLEDPRR